MQKNKKIYWLWIAAVIILLDQASKAWVRANFELYDVMELTSWFNLVRLHNTGAAFSFLSDAGGWQQWLFIGLAVAVVVGVVIWMRLNPSMRSWDAIALSLLVGGALGNVIDRVWLGYVLDFADFYLEGCGPPLIWIMQYCHWPAFNVADVAISCAAFMLIVSTFFPQKDAAPETKG